MLISDKLKKVAIGEVGLAEEGCFGVNTKNVHIFLNLDFGGLFLKKSNKKGILTQIHTYYILFQKNSFNLMPTA